MLLTVNYAYSRVTRFTGRDATQKLYDFLHILVIIKLLSWQRGVFQAEKKIMDQEITRPKEMAQLSKMGDVKTRGHGGSEFSTSSQNNFDVSAPERQG